MTATILSARRAYEFKLDDLRLSLLSSANVVSWFQESFVASGAQIGTPIPTFGEVAQTFPPGIVVVLGSIAIEGKESVPLRALNFEANRIVIDVSGPSATIDVVFERLKIGLEDLKTQEGVPAIGTPVRQRDYSDIRWPAGTWDLDRLVNPPVLQALRGRFPSQPGSDARMSVPSLRLNMPRVAEPYPGQGTPDYEAVYIDLRSGTDAEDRAVFSSAPLATDAHLDLIEQLSEILGAD